MTKMPKQEIIEKYGDAELDFINYYKYTFTYSGTYHGDSITVNFCDSDIYRVDLGFKETVKNLLDEDGEHTSILVNGDYVL